MGSVTSWRRHQRSAVSDEGLGEASCQHGAGWGWQRLQRGMSKTSFLKQKDLTMFHNAMDFTDLKQI